jgi:hypothetical protein
MTAFASIQDLKNRINASIYANDAGLVTAEDLQECLHDVIDTLDALNGSGGDISALEEVNALSAIYAGSKKVATEEWVGEQNFIPAAEKGEADGVASLGSDGKVPASQLPAAAVGGDTSQVTMANFWIGQENGKIVFKHEGVVIGSLDSTGYFKAKNEIEGFVAAP